MTTNTNYTNSVAQRCSVKKGLLKISKNSQETPVLESLYYLIKLLPQASNFIKKGSLSESFSYKFCAMLKNIFFYRTSPVATSELLSKSSKMLLNPNSL